jgi:hypothetical protein
MTVGRQRRRGLRWGAGCLFCSCQEEPAIVGHSFGGLLTRILAGRGLAAASVAIDPAPFRGVLPLPVSVLRSAFPVLGNPANRDRAVPLTYEQVRYAFANAVSEEAKQLYEDFAVPTSGRPLFHDRDRRIPGRGHALIIDSGWREVANKALASSSGSSRADAAAADVAAAHPPERLGPELAFELHEAPDLRAVHPDVGLDPGGGPADGGQVDAEQGRAPLQRGRDRPVEGGVVGFPGSHDR